MGQVIRVLDSKWAKNVFYSGAKTKNEEQLINWILREKQIKKMRDATDKELKWAGVSEYITQYLLNR